MNKIVLKFASDTKEYPCLILGGDFSVDPSDRDNRIEISDGTRPITARLFMDDVQYNALPTYFKSGPITSPPVLAAIQITCDNCLEYASVDTTLKSVTIQTSYCFMLDRAQIVRSGVDNNIRRIELSSVQEAWQYLRRSQTWNHDAGYEKIPVDIADLPAAYSTRQAILDSLFSNINTYFRFGLSAPTIPVAAYDGEDFLPPLNFSSSGNPQDKMIRRLLEPCCQQLIYNPWVAALGDTGTFSVVNLAPTDTQQTDTLALIEKCRINGMSATSESEPWGAWQSPGKIYFNDIGSISYETNNNIASDAGYDTVTISGRPNIFGEYVYNSDYPNDGECKTRFINQIGTAIANRSDIKPRVYVLSGAYPIVPGNAFRHVSISVSDSGIITTIAQHGRSSSSEEDGGFLKQEDIHIQSNQGTRIKRTQDGHINVFGGHTCGMFAVRLVHQGAGLYNICVFGSSDYICSDGEYMTPALSYALDNTTATTLTVGIAYYDISGNGELHVIGMY